MLGKREFSEAKTELNRRQTVGDGVRESGGGYLIKSPVLSSVSSEENPKMRV